METPEDPASPCEQPTGHFVFLVKLRRLLELLEKEFTRWATRNDCQTMEFFQTIKTIAQQQIYLISLREHLLLNERNAFLLSYLDHRDEISQNLSKCFYGGDTLSQRREATLIWSQARALLDSVIHMIDLSRLEEVSPP